jgi:hypothetical protein
MAPLSRRHRLLLALPLLLLAPCAGAAETTAVLAVGDPFGGPEPELVELTQLLQSACRGSATVQDPLVMRARLGGVEASNTIAELERAYASGLGAVNQPEEETWRAAKKGFLSIVDELEKLPDSQEAYGLRIRALLHAAYMMLIIEPGDPRALMEKVLVLEPDFQLDEGLSRPDYVQMFESVRARVKAKAKIAVTISSSGPPGLVYVDGRPSGTTPVTLKLPYGKYQIGGSIGSIHLPKTVFEVKKGSDHGLTLDFAAGQALRLNKGPGLAMSRAESAVAVPSLGAWLRVDQVVLTRLVKNGQVHFLAASLYDGRSGALLREGMVRVVPAPSPTGSLGMLVSFLFNGQPSPEVLPAGKPPPLTEAELLEQAKEAKKGSSQRRYGVIAGGVGIALLATGAVFDLSAYSAYNDAKKASTAGDRARFDSQKSASVSRGKLANVFYAAGVVGLGTGAVLYLTARDRPPPVTVVPINGGAVAFISGSLP